jgi:hypothetical protein
MNQIFKPETRLALAKRLSNVRAVSNKACYGFRITGDPKKVRMSLDDFKQLGNSENYMYQVELCDMICQRGQEETEINLGSGTSEKANAIKISKDSIDQVVKKIKKSARKIKKNVISAIGEQISTDFANFLGRVDEARFEERLDQLLVRELAGNKLKWKSDMKKKVLSALENLEQEFLETLQVCRTTISRLLEDDPPISTPEFNGFAKKSLQEIQSAKRNDWVCFGQGGISKRPGTMDFMVLSRDGSLALCNGVSSQLIKELQIKVNGNKYTNSCVEFSPSGINFLVTICDDKELFTFRTNDFSQMDKWTRNDCQFINKARWINEDHILAGYEKPGHLELYKLGEKNPLFKISPAELVGCAIQDIDISRDKNHAFCGSGCTMTVFKVAIYSKSNSMLWRHNAHGNYINSIRLSQNEKYVLSTGDDKKAVLASAIDGAILSLFNGFNYPQVVSVLWCPGDRRVFVLFVNELVLLEVG